MTPEQIEMIEGLTGINAMYDTPVSAPLTPPSNPSSTVVDRPEQDVLALDPKDYQSATHSR